MQAQKMFPLRIAASERQRAKRLAGNMGLSENRLYVDLIQEGLLMREQIAYLEKLRSLQIPARVGLEILDKAPDIQPSLEDRLPRRTAR